jgi:hypothetical protein
VELEGLVSVKTLLRWLIAIPLILAGCWFYFVSGLIGGGMHLDPSPGWGMLIAGAALVAMIGGYFLIRTEKPEYILAAIINIALGMGALELLYGGGVWIYEVFRPVQIAEPGQLPFWIGYGALSAMSFVGFNLWIRKSNDGAVSADA